MPNIENMNSDLLSNNLVVCEFFNFLALWSVLYYNNYNKYIISLGISYIYICILKDPFFILPPPFFIVHHMANSMRSGFPTQSPNSSSGSQTSKFAGNQGRCGQTD